MGCLSRYFMIGSVQRTDRDRQALPAELRIGMESGNMIKDHLDQITEMEQEAQRELLAVSRDVMALSRNTLLINLPFMAAALGKLKSVLYTGTFAVDGDSIWYDPIHLLQQYGSEHAKGPRSCLHMLLHCVFRHFDVSPSLDREKWDLACDMAVENVIAELGITRVTTGRESLQKMELDKLQSKVNGLTAERLYRFLTLENPDKKAMERWKAIFGTDDHEVWYRPGCLDPLAKTVPMAAEYSDRPGSGDGSADTQKARSDAWKDASGRMKQDLENFHRRQGSEAGSLMQNLRAVTRESYDYSAFLRKFAVVGEVMRVNEDEFDNVFYTYGLRAYPDRRMPLIEPLEYKEVKRIREFVIAIDTSGSVMGDLVQRFIQKTYNILKSTESFFTKINLHIIQCDAEIQEKVKITSQEEFDEYLKNMTILGLGGTDFRPVFEYVDELIAKKEFTNLKGLIYFTDGEGIFPGKVPAYKTAFVFADENGHNTPVPPWAIKLVLDDDQV